MTFRTDYIVKIIGVSASLFAAGLWFYASILAVPDNIDTFIGELQRISRWNSYAAMAAGVAACCGAYEFLRLRPEKPGLR
jgi:uncharacterized membrane protein